jgi:hypothetical protein
MHLSVVANSGEAATNNYAVVYVFERLGTKGVVSNRRRTKMDILTPSWAAIDDGFAWRSMPITC